MAMVEFHSLGAGMREMPQSDSPVTTVFAAAFALEGAVTGAASLALPAAWRMAAVALRRSHSALRATFRRTSVRKGYRVAVCATARKLAQLANRMLSWDQDYVDFGEQAREPRFRPESVAGRNNAAEPLGYELIPQTPASSAVRRVAKAVFQVGTRLVRNTVGRRVSLPQCPQGARSC